MKALERKSGEIGLPDAASACFRPDAWYHGSPLELAELAAGSTVTRWKELAAAFSHKPQTLCYDTVGGNISHDGQLVGHLYVVDEAVAEGADVRKHPGTAMDDGVEWLTARPLRLREIIGTATGPHWATGPLDQ